MPREGKSKERKPKTINILCGFFFYVNLCIGNGFLSFPFTFVYSGYLAAVPTLVLLTMVSWASSNYVLEVMARAQALEYLKQSKEAATSTSSDSETDHSEHAGRLTIREHPKFELTLQRKFELSDLCQIFFNKGVKYVYLISQSLYIFSCCWSQATVAGSAWAINVPFFYIRKSLTCSSDAFLHHILPTGGCLYAYYLSIAVFSVIVVTLSLLDLKQQTLFQAAMGILRFSTIAATIIYCIYRLVEGGDACLDYGNRDTYENISYSNIESTLMARKFDPKGWLQSIPIMLFANMFQVGIPSLSYPIKQKRFLHWLVIAMTAAAFVAYLSLGLVLSLWFRATIQETCTLNWAVFTRSKTSLTLYIFSYYLVFFPSLDVLSSFTLNVHIQVNSFYSVIMGHDTSENPKYKHDWLLRVLLRFTAAMLPIGAALGISNLVYVLKIGGFFGLACYFASFTLQVRSIYVCKKAFGKHMYSRKLLHLEGTSKNPEESSKSEVRKSKSHRHVALLSKKERINDRNLYMTPYSFPFLSQPLVGWMMVVVGAVLYVFTFVDFFFVPDKLHCIAKGHL